MTATQDFAVAVIADAHFHDIEGDFDFPGVAAADRRLCLRSWADTVTAGRAFNESGAALCAALRAIVERGVRHVVLLGDYTDDGQAETTRRLAALLAEAQDRHGLNFFAIPGNHDVYGPSGKHTATRFLNAAGGTTLVTSDPSLAHSEADAVLTPAMRCLGLPDGLTPMAGFGLFRQQAYLHWETPFGLSDDPENRVFAAHSADGTVTRRLMDASYLVEPEAGLWLLMIDATVFEPRNGAWQAGQKRAFIDPAAAGWNAVLRVKPFLLVWIADVCDRARRLGKRLLAFSHYPVADPFEDRSGAEAALFGETEVARRTPGPAVVSALKDAGLTHLAGGHVHANGNTQVGQFLSVAVPSPVAFPPAFKILRPGAGWPAVETVSLSDLPLDPVLQGFYRREASMALPDATDFGGFLAAQMRARVVSHTIPRDWPESLRARLAAAGCADLVRLMLGRGALDADATVADACHDWMDAHDIAAEARACTLQDLIADWYLLRQAGALADGHVPAGRLLLCRALAASFADPHADPHSGDRGYFARFLGVLAESLRRRDRG